MRYVESTLTEGESVVLGPVPVTKWEYLSWWSLLIVPIFALWIRRYATEYAVTSRRMVKKTGLIARSGDELRLRRIESVQVHQGLVGRIFGFGDVVATGQGHQVVTFHKVVDPMAVKRAMEEAIERAEYTPAPPGVDP